MKYFWIGVLILGLLLSCCWWSEQAVERSAVSVLEPLGEAIAAAEQGRPAAEPLRRAQALWRQKEGLLASLVSHSSMEELRWGLAELPLLDGAELRRLALRLQHRLLALAEGDDLRWRNLF